MRERQRPSVVPRAFNSPSPLVPSPRDWAGRGGRSFAKLKWRMVGRNFVTQAPSRDEAEGILLFHRAASSGEHPMVNLPGLGDG